MGWPALACARQGRVPCCPAPPPAQSQIRHHAASDGGRGAPTVLARAAGPLSAPAGGGGSGSDEAARPLSPKHPPVCPASGACSTSQDRRRAQQPARGWPWAPRAPGAHFPPTRLLTRDAGGQGGVRLVLRRQAQRQSSSGGGKRLLAGTEWKIGVRRRPAATIQGARRAAGPEDASSAIKTAPSTRAGEKRAPPAALRSLNLLPQHAPSCPAAQHST